MKIHHHWHECIVAEIKTRGFESKSDCRNSVAAQVRAQVNLYFIVTEMYTNMPFVDTLQCKTFNGVSPPSVFTKYINASI